MKNLSKEFWNQKYLDSNTPWDIGDVSPPLKSFIDQIKNKNIRILIPGAGNAYEAVYLFENRFQNVFVCDWAEEAFDSLKTQIPTFPKSHLLVSDFFELELEIDLILEQTFFCAIDPNLRHKYVQKSADLLSSGGLIAGLLFASEFPMEGPPFGGTATEYRKLFEPFFEIETLEIAKNSIKPRLGNELFFKMWKK